MVHKSGELFVRIIYLAFMLFVVEMKFLFLKCYYQWFKELTVQKIIQVSTRTVHL